MIIKVAHLYYDLMNLYGERGNVIALKRSLEDQGIEVELDELSIGDNIDFNKYDVYIIGSGTESNQERVMKNLLKYKDNIKKAIVDDNKFFLCTGNAIELFGKSIMKPDGNLIEGLGIFDFTATRQAKRVVSQILFNCPFINQKIIGFQNQGATIDNYKFNLFTVERGIGAHPDNKTEGIKYNNFFGTYVIGPLLARNPEFLKYFITLIIKSKDALYNVDEYNFDLEVDKKAYNAFMKNNYPGFIK